MGVFCHCRKWFEAYRKSFAKWRVESLLGMQTFAATLVVTATMTASLDRPLAWWDLKTLNSPSLYV